ncbi:MAG: hypothetical protein K2J02_00395 [Malacoplasma sp.]|nr:hypothetical protein [Malacoplasma sp.]MDE6893819.1 hypothetical protein [Malacoplasma sp.]MDE7075264.1 hypothetical protein [Malacoplasma sp.]
MARVSRKKKNDELVKSRVITIKINEKVVVYIDEWYLEELVDIIKQYPGKKYFELIDRMIFNSKRKKPSFPQLNLASHRVIEKKSNFFEFPSIEEYINETWLNSEKISLLKVNSNKKMYVKYSTVGSVPHIPSYLNNLSPNNMLTFQKEKSVIFKKATILINVSGNMNWKDYRKIIRDYFRIYDFESLSLGNISKTTENKVDYYRISIVKIRNGVNVNGQGLMFESADFLRRMMFMIYEIDPTNQYWNAYGNTVYNKDIQMLKEYEPYFGTILERYLNPSLILVE